MLVTHWHPDHVGGLEDLQILCPNTSIYKYLSPQRPHPAINNIIIDHQVFEVEGITLRAFHCPGHTDDHMSFILMEENSMFTGDNVLGHGTAVFENLVVYLDSLDRMGEQFEGRAYPGHGEVIEDGPGRIKQYVAHRQEREEGILEALRAIDREVVPMELVKVIYMDVPHSLHDSAASGVFQVLQKLETEGKVAHVDGRWHTVENAAL